MKNILKNNRGISGADALLAVALVILFSGIITTLAYNIYITSNSLKRSSQALEYITSTFEYIANQYYDDVTETNINSYINDTLNEKVSTEESEKAQYIANVTITNYNEMEGNTDKLDLVKEITMSVTYNLGNKNQKIEMKTAKTKEKLEVPNRPELDFIQITEGQYKYAIKYVNENWKVTSKNDADWYNYDKGMWATVLITSEPKSIGDAVSNADGSIRLWIPRFEYNPNSSGYEVNFLYKNTNKQIVNENGTTKIIDRTLEKVPETFTNQGQDLTGVWITEGSLNSDPYKFFNKSKYKLDEEKYSKIW